VAVLETAADSARAAMAGDRPELSTVLPLTHPAAAPAASLPGGQSLPNMRRTAREQTGTDTAAGTSDTSALVAGLTLRELEIARLVGRGMTNQGVAQQLGLSPHTVSFHLRNIFRKLSISTRVRLSTIMLQAEPTQPGGAAPSPARRHETRR
jgi:DNA-binding CsgD family transcriptional regulator